jgi:hypothetical protein
MIKTLLALIFVFTCSTATAGPLAIQFTCTNTGTNAFEPIKLSMNDTEAYFLTVNSGVYGVATSSYPNTATTKFGFRAYSSPTSKTCNVVGMQKTILQVNGQSVQVFTPVIDYSRTLLLGTKGYKTYSTTIAP